MWSVMGPSERRCSEDVLRPARLPDLPRPGSPPRRPRLPTPAAPAPHPDAPRQPPKIFAPQAQGKRGREGEGEEREGGGRGRGGEGGTGGGGCGRSHAPPDAARRRPTPPDGGPPMPRGGRRARPDGHYAFGVGRGPGGPARGPVGWGMIAGRLWRGAGGGHGGIGGPPERRAGMRARKGWGDAWVLAPSPPSAKPARTGRCRPRPPAYMYSARRPSGTYDHRSQRTEDPVRSPELKLRTGGLVVRWVTTCEYPLLYVLPFSCLFCRRAGPCPHRRTPAVCFAVLAFCAPGDRGPHAGRSGDDPDAECGPCRAHGPGHSRGERAWGGQGQWAGRSGGDPDAGPPRSTPEGNSTFPPVWHATRRASSPQVGGRNRRSYGKGVRSIVGRYRRVPPAPLKAAVGTTKLMGRY